MWTDNRTVKVGRSLLMETSSHRGMSAEVEMDLARGDGCRCQLTCVVAVNTPGLSLLVEVYSCRGMTAIRGDA